MKILALDQASNVSGWAIFQDGKLDSYGKIDLHSITNVYERLHELKLQVKFKKIKLKRFFQKIFIWTDSE